MVNHVNGETRIEGPDVYSIGVNLGIQYQVIPLRLRLHATNHTRVSRVCSLLSQQRGGHRRFLKRFFSVVLLSESCNSFLQSVRGIAAYAERGKA